MMVVSHTWHRHSWEMACFTCTHTDMWTAAVNGVAMVFTIPAVVHQTQWMVWSSLFQQLFIKLSECYGLHYSSNCSSNSVNAMVFTIPAHQTHWMVWSSLFQLIKLIEWYGLHYSSSSNSLNGMVFTIPAHQTQWMVWSSLFQQLFIKLSECYGLHYSSNCSSNLHHLSLEN